MGYCKIKYNSLINFINREDYTHMMNQTSSIGKLPIKMIQLLKEKRLLNSQRKLKQQELRRRESRLKKNYIKMFYRLMLDAYNHLNGRNHSI